MVNEMTTATQAQLCEEKRCTYYRFYLAQGPADLEHEGYHFAEQHCNEAQAQSIAWLKEHYQKCTHPRCWDAHHDPYERSAAYWERQVRA